MLGRFARASGAHVPADTVTRAEPANLFRADVELLGCQMREQFTSAVGFLRMPQHIEENMQLPPIGITNHRAPLSFVFILLNEGERFIEVLEQATTPGWNHRFQKREARAHQTRRSLSGLTPIAHQKKCAEVEGTGLALMDQLHDLIPRQSSIKAVRHLCF